MEIIATYCENHIKAINVHCIKNSDLFNDKARGAYTNHYAYSVKTRSIVTYIKFNVLFLTCL
jgi:hypothetical protein